MLIPQLAFAYPWLLTALVLLPAIWWLLRFTPPRPSRVAFPPTRILLELGQSEETSSTTPWWLVALRMLIAALVILAMTGPVLNPPAVTAEGDGPLLLIVDNGWGANEHWSTMSAAADQVLDQAQRSERPVLLVATAEDAPVGAPGSATQARERLAGLTPAPHAPDRAALADGLVEAVDANEIGEVVWLSDGLSHGIAGGGEVFAERLAEAAEQFRVVVPADEELPIAMAPARNEAGGLTATALRASPDGRLGGRIVARDGQGRVVEQVPFAFSEGETEQQVAFDLPVQIRNEIGRVEIAGAQTSGGIQLLDDRWQRRVVGLVSGESSETAQPLLSPLHYISRAMGPFADLREASDPGISAAIDELLDERVSALVLADIGTLIGGSRDRVEEWVEQGGVLVRFAGPRLAGSEQAPLVPAPLRRGERALGGTLSWSEPQALADFPADGPFAGIAVPDDVRIERQVLAEPSAGLAERTWARLDDGTPLVTGTRIGDGWLVLFHVTADTAWSNLPISGAFVEMLRRTVDLAGVGEGGAGSGGGAGEILRPLQALTASGTLVAPPGNARPVNAAEIESVRPSTDHPPGLYGEPDRFRALNVIGPDTVHAALDIRDLAPSIYPADDTRALGPWLLAAALALLVIDGLAVMMLNGRGIRFGWQRTAPLLVAGMVAALALAAPQPAQAQSESDLDGDEFALAATLETRLAYVITGNPEIDEVSRAGLAGLSRELTRRTALEPAEPMGVDAAEDELAFFQFLYWPIDHDAAPPSERVMERIDTYMRQGGTVLFDTRDAVEQTGAGNDGPGMRQLRTMMRGMDLPELEPVPSDHVVTKTFYLLDDFPGRWEGGALWVESAFRRDEQSERPVQNADGVSGIMITSNDLAGAWAVGEGGSYLYPTSPGGDGQRETAYRAGINIVMYAMTGNYKADQVHVPALLERLGQ